MQKELGHPHLTKKRNHWGAAAVAVTRLGPAWAQKPPKVAAIHEAPVENAWNAVLHAALTSAAADGLLEYVYSEDVAAGDYPRAMREYADQGAVLVVGQSHAVEREAREGLVRITPTELLRYGLRGPLGL